MRIKHPEWLESHEPTNYPFADDATLANDDGATLFPETLLDAAFYPVGGSSGGYVSRIEITTTAAIIWYGDNADNYRAYGKFDLGSPPDVVRVLDTYGRPAGMLVSESVRLAIFQSWSVGVYDFTVDQTGLVAAVCMPAPEIGLRGIQADDGTVLTGDVYIVGDDGVRVTCREQELPASCGVASRTVNVLRVDLLGDPLWRRRECAPGFFTTPRFLEQVVFQQGPRSLQCQPSNGNVRIIAANDLATDTVLRIRPINEGIQIEAVGERLEDIKPTD